MNSADRLVGLVLVTLGVMLLVVLQTDVGGEAVVAMIGAVFLVAYAVTRAYGFLVPGGILTGLGTGIILQSQGVQGEIVVLGLAAGFLGIALVDAVSGVQPARLWPVIPGGILAIVGLSQYMWAGAVLRWWPLVVIAAGLWLIVASQRSRTPSAAPPALRRAAPPPPPPPPADRPRATVPPSSNG